MSETVNKEFGKVRSILWPIYTFELKKILPMLLMFFCISFNYTILRDMKDSLVVTAGGSGAEVIPFLKLYGVLPGAVMFILIYSKLSNKLSKPALFYATLSPFLIFFALFALVLYPAKDFLHPYAFADKMQSLLPTGFMGLIAVLRNWVFSIFYILSELWGSVVLSLLFWGFANDITKVKEAKRFYALFLTGANVALLVSGPTIRYFANLPKKLAAVAGVDPWGMTINKLMLLVVLMGLIIMGCYYYMNKSVLTDSRFYSPEEMKSSKKTKPKLSMKESFKFIFSSKYLGLLAVLVVGYGIAINLVEVTWKSQLKLEFPNSNDYLAFMGAFSTVTGFVTILTTMFLGGNIMRRFGWRFSALLTPVMLILTGISFLGFIVFKHKLPTYLLGGITLQFFIVLLGAAQNILSKSCKYTFFDPTKEMAYIPLDQESKVKGKAAVDVVGARLGKSGGSLLQQGLIIMCGGIVGIAPYAMILVLGIVTVWMFSANSLSKLFEEKNAEMEKRKISEEDLKVVAKSSKEGAVN
ncbi:MAG: AAA family ATPase [Chlamydiae bacterium RIFCSPHIGHO2_12_FULL_27_8]|nr:MAG: AAA family ATPase [Chlamydiae bacterium RIFCSPHIGHO2_12_FULL_27_8]